SLTFSEGARLPEIEGRTAHAYENEVRGWALPVKPAQRPEFIAWTGVGALRPVLHRRTWSTAPLESTWSQRRSQTSGARSQMLTSAPGAGFRRQRRPLAPRQH